MPRPKRTQLPPSAARRWSIESVSVVRVSGLGLIVARGIAAERKRLGLTQRELAERVGWSRQTITSIEASDRSVRAEELPAICRALGVTLDDLARDASEEDRRALGIERRPKRR